jgi:pimeloyl-ACP methyl ester carboxylesterase
MLKSPAVRAAAGVLLCIAGFLLSRASGYRQTTVRIDAGGCHMVTDIVDNGTDAVQGSVVLLHGLAANKEIMSYLARSFARQNLRVFVPDLPGHGRTPGPFSPARAEVCTDKMLRQLIVRGALNPSLTVLAGHSMGGAIALRVASRTTVAGVIAISPAPMRDTHGIWRELLLFSDPPPAPANTLVLSGAFEPQSVRDSARELLPSPPPASEKYQIIPGATHAGLLFDRNATNAMLDWTAHVLRAAPTRATSPLRMLLAPLLGFLGLFLLARPFLREILTETPATRATARTTSPQAAALDVADAKPSASLPRLCLEVLLCSLPVVVLLQYWHPLRFIRVFEGDYFAGFLLLLGILLLLLKRGRLTGTLRVAPGKLIAAIVAALVFLLLATAWSDLTVSEAWLTLDRWLRFPVLLVAVLPYHYAEEVLLGSAAARSPTARLSYALLLRVLAWCVLLAALLLLHSGQILLVLLIPYIAAFCLLQRAGMDAVRKDTGSPVAAAVFGAILLAGFCMVIFPIT